MIKLLFILLGISLLATAAVACFLRGARGDDNTMGDEAAHPSRFDNNMENSDGR